MTRRSRRELERTLNRIAPDPPDGPLEIRIGGPEDDTTEPDMEIRTWRDGAGEWRSERIDPTDDTTADQSPMNDATDTTNVQSTDHHHTTDTGGDRPW